MIVKDKFNEKVIRIFSRNSKIAIKYYFCSRSKTVRLYKMFNMVIFVLFQSNGKKKFIARRFVIQKNLVLMHRYNMLKRSLL